VTSRILVLGDSFCRSSAIRDAFAELETAADVTYADVGEVSGWTPTTPSERGLREVLAGPDEVIERLADHDVLVVQGAAISDAVLDADAALRLVCCMRGGPVNVDVAAATARGIPVAITPGKNADAVAELTIAFLVMLARRLPEVIRHIEGGGQFGHDNFEGARWFGRDLAGRTLGLVGYGQVGRRVARRALAFEMPILVFDPFVDPAVIAADGATPADLDGLLVGSDAISLHARATGDNHGLIGREAIGRMRDGVLLVNTARDSLLDEAAVAEGLAAGRIGGLAVDVVSPSPEVGRHPLLRFPNVLVTTHIGGATVETLRHGAEMAAAEIGRFLRGDPLGNVADRNALTEDGRVPERRRDVPQTSASPATPASHA